MLVDDGPLGWERRGSYRERVTMGGAQGEFGSPNGLTNPRPGLTACESGKFLSACNGTGSSMRFCIRRRLGSISTTCEGASKTVLTGRLSFIAFLLTRSAGMAARLRPIGEIALAEDDVF